MTTGPNAAPKRPQAFSTMSMMLDAQEPGPLTTPLAAMAKATNATIITTKRPTQSISMSVARFLRMTGW